MKRTALVLVVLAFLSGCATRITHPPAPAEDLAKVTSYQLEQNEARVHFYLGCLHAQGATIPMREAAELYINNVRAGVIGSEEEYIAIDLPPGTYTFEYKLVSSPSVQPKPLQLTISEKELVFLSANFADVTPDMAYLFGPLGVLASLKQITFLQQNTLEGKQVITERRLVALNKTIKNELKTIAP